MRIGGRKKRKISKIMVFFRRLAVDTRFLSLLFIKKSCELNPAKKTSLQTLKSGQEVE